MVEAPGATRISDRAPREAESQGHGGARSLQEAPNGGVQTVNATIAPSMFSEDWRDAFGKSFAELVREARYAIEQSDPEPFRYDPCLYPMCALREAWRQLRNAWQRQPVTPVPVIAGEELIRTEVLLIDELLSDSTHPIALENAERSRRYILSVEARYPGTLARIEEEKPGILAR